MSRKLKEVDNNGWVDETLPLRMLHGLRNSMRRNIRSQVAFSETAEEPVLPLAVFTAAMPLPEAPVMVEPTIAEPPAPPTIRSIETARPRRVAVPRLAGRRTAASAGAFGIALTAVLGSSVGMAAAAPAPSASTGAAANQTATAAASPSSTKVQGNCDSSGSAEASLTIPSGSPVPTYNLTATPSIYNGSAPMVNEGDTLKVNYADEAGFTATGTVTGPWSGPVSTTTPFSDTSKVLAGFTVTPTTHAGTQKGGPPVLITGVVPAVANNGPGFYAVTISTADNDDKIPLPCKVQWLLNVGQPTQTLAGIVYQCPAAGFNTANAAEVTGATLTPSGGSGTVPSAAGSHFGPTNVDASPNWSVKATVPTGWQMLTGCPGFSPSTGDVATSTLIDSSSASETVPVATSGSGRAVFFAQPVTNPNTPTIKIFKTDDTGGQATAGVPFDWNLRVVNQGPGTAKGVQVTDSVPPGFVINSVSSPCTFTGRSVSCSLGDMADSAQQTVTINVTADGTKCGPITNQGFVTSTNAGGDNSTDPVNVTCPNFRIDLHKSASVGDNATIKAGTSFTYTLVATNNGNGAANNVVVTDAIPSLLSVTGASSSPGSCTTSGNNVSCSVGNLAANGGSATITINVATSSASCGVVNNMGQVTAGGGTTGNSNTVTTTITCAENVGITVGVVKTNNAQDPTGTDFGKVETAQTLGETFNYQAVITNTSPVSELIGTITDTIAGQPIQDVCPNLVGQTLASQASITCTFQGVAPNTSGASEVDTVTVPVSQVGVPTNTATATDTSTVLTPPGVIITKANNADGTGYGPSEQVKAGSTSVPYQVTVTNPNSSPGTITALTDTIDGNVANICPDLIGKVLAPSGQPNDSVVCNFTTTVPTSVTTDTAGVTLSVNGVLVNGTAQSTVFPPVLGTQITPATPAPAALAFTGPRAPIGKMLGMALGMIALGLLFLVGLQVVDGRKRPSLRFATVDRSRPADGGQVRAKAVGRPRPDWRPGTGYYQVTATAAAATWVADRIRGGLHRRR